MPAFRLLARAWQHPRTLRSLPAPITAFGLEVNLVWLDSTTETTDANLREIARFKQITVLSVTWAPITDAGLKEVAQLQQLFSLSLFGSEQITDADLKEVAKLQQLTELNLMSCKQITDVGLKEATKLQ